MHPHDAASFDPARDLDAIRALVARGAVAIGECGLDSHYDHSPRDLQRRAFAAQLALARELDRPVVVHTRDAEDDTRAMVVEAGQAGVRGVLHCYTGSHALAEAALDVGWYVSFSGIVTFKKWDDDALIRLVPPTGCSSSRTRRISRRCRTAESGTSRRGLASPSRGSPRRAASTPSDARRADRGEHRSACSVFPCHRGAIREPEDRAHR